MLALAQVGQVEVLRVGPLRISAFRGAMVDALVSVAVAKLRLMVAGTLRMALVRPPQTLSGRCRV